MKYIIEVFEKESELVVFEVNLPEGSDSQLAQIMGWSVPQRGDEGYDLTTSQAAAIEALAGKQFYDSNHVFQLTCNVD
ncbi:hypothetical protein AFK24_07240 [Pseudomonas syringae]|uniref:DUF7683 domain-containing protein n=1 Tax=Pseudomonas syringae TaxID=317 RepID=A0A1C7Z6M8_PSESX|nr:hypothetical protein [Pseudomonas syringae]OCR25744.1 hypothetical protein AFK24_07240 [Pseudomonas syringae]